MARVVQTHPRTLLCCVGGNEQEIKDYQDVAQGLGLSLERVIFVERVPPFRIPLYLKAFDVLVMPFPWVSHYAFFMSALKLFEYMAACKPITASDLPSIREILQDGKNGVLVEPDNAKALAEGIKKVLEDGSLARSVANQARQDANEYSWDNRCKNILRFINLETV